MSARRLSLLAAVALLTATPVCAQSGDPFADIQNGTDPLARSIRQAGSGVASQYAGDPQVQQMYMQAQQQGYQGSYEQFILDQVQSCWGQCVGRAMADNAANLDRVQGTWRDEQAAEAAAGAAIAGMNADNSWRAGEAGHTLQGTESRYDQQTGRCYAVAYTPAGEPYQGEVACPPNYQ